MFRVYFTNHQYFSERRFDAFEDAVAWGKAQCFDFEVHKVVGPERCGAFQLLASWTVFGGLRYHPGSEGVQVNLMDALKRSLA